MNDEERLLNGLKKRRRGSLEKAIVNASRSMDEVQKEGRDYTFSELGRLMKRLATLSE